jgi:hypothetical protein
MAMTPKGNNDMNELQAKQARDNYAKLIFRRTASNGRARLYAKICPYTGVASERVSQADADQWVKTLGRVIVDTD